MSRTLICSTLIVILTMFCSAVSRQSEAAASPKQATEERLWVDRAAILVDRAATGRADGKTFVKDVKVQRAELRELMRKTGTDIPEEQRQLQMSMVLLGVLLKTASGCQSAGRVVCPVSLLSQIRSVLKNTYVNLNAFEGMTANVDMQKVEQ